MSPCAPAPLCRHLRTDGTPCGSPALRGKPLCFYHDAGHRPLAVTRDLGRLIPNLPAPDDLHAIQIGYTQLFRLIAEDAVEPRIATLLLRTLAHASQNLARIHRRERTHPAASVTDLTLDPTFGPLAMEAIHQNQYFSESDKILPDTAAAETSGLPSTDSGPTDSGGPSFAAPSQRVGYRLRQQTTDLYNPATPADQAPTPTLRHAPELPAAIDPGPLTLNEQYVTIDRDRHLPPEEKQPALDALTFRMVDPTPEDRRRDQEILAARKQQKSNQYFTENQEIAESDATLALIHAAAA